MRNPNLTLSIYFSIFKNIRQFIEKSLLKYNEPFEKKYKNRKKQLL